MAILATAAFGGVVLAHGIDREEIDSRVAEILEVDEQTVTDAIEQKAEDAVQERLDKLVENGSITQEKADEFKAWYAERPDGMPGPRFGRWGFHRSGESISALVAETLGEEEETVSAAISQAVSEARSEALQERLAQAVEAGKLTQEQADGIAERIASGEHKGFHRHAGKGWKCEGWGLRWSGGSN